MPMHSLILCNTWIGSIYSIVLHTSKVSTSYNAFIQLSTDYQLSDIKYDIGTFMDAYGT